MKKAIITVVGKDTVGIIAKVCTFLSENQVNVLDITQTIVDGFFTMMMVVDVTNQGEQFDHLVTGLNDLGEQVGVRILCQKEDIFTKMHRI